MEIYVFGNEDNELDNRTFGIVRKLAKKYQEISFIKIKPNQELPFADRSDALIIDVVYGIDKVTLIESKNLEGISLPPRSTTHDYDLAFQLKYLRKLGKLGKVQIIGIPVTGNVDYNLIHSILRKLVEQDIQGS